MDSILGTSNRFVASTPTHTRITRMAFSLLSNTITLIARKHHFFLSLLIVLCSNDHMARAANSHGAFPLRSLLSESRNCWMSSSSPPLGERLVLRGCRIKLPCYCSFNYTSPFRPLFAKCTWEARETRGTQRVIIKVCFYFRSFHC